MNDNVTDTQDSMVALGVVNKAVGDMAEWTKASPVDRYPWVLLAMILLQMAILVSKLVAQTAALRVQVAMTTLSAPK